MIEPEEDKEPKKPIPISQKIDKFAQKIKEVQEREEREEKEREEKGVLYDVIYLYSYYVILYNESYLTRLICIIHMSHKV